MGEADGDVAEGDASTDMTDEMAEGGQKEGL